MKKVKLLVGSLAVLAVLWLSVPALLLAQGELSLEGLSTRLQVLVARMNALTERIEFIEAVWTGPGAVNLGNGTCIIGGQGVDSMQDITVLKYKETYGEWPGDFDVSFHSVRYDANTGHTLVVYSKGMFNDAGATEVWDGCTFVESSDWLEDE